MGSTGRGRRFGVALWAGIVLALTAVSPAFAQPVGEASAARDGDVLTGRLARIRHTGTVRLGYREHAVPFSFAGPRGSPYGYSIDLCLAIVEEIAGATGGRPLRVEYRPVTPENRIDLVVNGEVDLECGATTNTAERRERVAFSPVTFVSGTRLAVRRSSGIRSRDDLVGRTVAVARGTTNEAVIRGIVAKTGLRAEIVTTQDIAQAFALVASGKADAVASDDVLLLGYLSETGQRAQFDLVGELLSYEPYGIVFARDDAPLADAVGAAFRRLAGTRELRWIYVRWFMRQLPSGIRLGLPMSPQLERSFQMMGLPPE
jgi:glutamate/aspartate transport system substrate-binding protein